MKFFGIQLGFKNAGFKRGIDEARRDVSAFKNDVKDLGKKLGGLVVGGAFVGMIKNVVDQAGALQDTADALDLNVEALQELRYAFGQSGTSSENFDKGLGKLTEKLAEAREGNTKTALTFERLGVSMEDIKSKGVDEILMEIADGFKKTGDAQAYSDVIELLGKSGKSMAAGLREGASGLQGLRNEASKMSTDEIARLDEAGDAWARFWNGVTSFSGSKLAKVMEFLGTYQDFSSSATVYDPNSPAAKKAKREAGQPTEQKPVATETGQVFGPTMKSFEGQKKREAEKEQEKIEDFENKIDDDLAKQKLRKAQEKARIKAHNDKFQEEFRAEEARRQADKDQSMDWLQGKREGMALSPDERRASKREALRRGIRERSADRAFANKYGKQALQELKDRQDPVKQAERAYKQALAESEKKLDDILTEISNWTAPNQDGE